MSCGGRLPLGPVLVTSLVAGLSCSKKESDAPRLGLSRCIENWPTAQGPHVVKPSLEVDAPKILWAVDVNGSQASGGRISDSDGGPVLAGDKLAFQAGYFIYFIDKDGTNPTRVAPGMAGSYPSGLVADPEGNVYSVTEDGVVCIRPDGSIRWQGGGVGHAEGEFPYYDPPVLGPDGTVYAVASDERVYALRTRDGSTVWSKPAQVDQYRSRVVGGAGNGLLVHMGEKGTDVLNTADGSALGSLKEVIDGATYGLIGPIMVGWDIGIAQSANFVYDFCGNLRWSRWKNLAPNSSGVVTVGEYLVVTSYQADDKGVPVSPNMLTLYDANGAVIGEPAPAEGSPLAAGADGTIYTVSCAASQPPTPTDRISAYSPDLTPLWHLDLNGGNGLCQGMTGNVVLDDDGVMYLMRASPNTYGTQVMAIQTRSPGLADSSWPSWRHDNRGTAWLVPGTPSATPPAGDSDGGSPANPIDAP
jgi:outer membrane protein assembly factor BamB